MEETIFGALKTPGSHVRDAAKRQAGREPCAECPWMSNDQRDVVAREPLRKTAESGAFFCCHVRLGRCEGSRLVAERAGNK
jgi:hypothetical protein